MGLLGTHLAEAADRLRARQVEVAETSRSLDAFFNLSRDLFCLARFDGYFVRLNPAWESALGFTRAELQSKPFMEWVHPDDRARTEAATAGLSSGEEAAAFENRYQCRDGSYRWLLWNARPRVAEGLIYATARDITEQREALVHLDELNTDLRARTQQLEAANRELEAFSYSVSHDLRAPLRAIDGFSQALEEDAADRLDEAGLDALRRVRAAARRMGILIDELLNLSRISRMELRREAIDLAELAAGVVDDLRQRDPARVVTVRVAERLPARADPRLLRIALQNLVDNAWKYTGKTADPAIEIGATERSRGREYFVRDNGAGFDMRYADKLFGAFQRLHTDREFEGTGVGLATVQRIVHRHGGRIRAEGDVGKGATFSFTLEPGAAEDS